MLSEILLAGLFCRSFGFFLFSPLFSKIPLPRLVRFGVAFSFACLVAPFMPSSIQVPKEGFLLFIFFAKEVLLGYLLGTIFSLILESAALAGQLIGTLAGFSATELFDPLSSSSYPLWSKIFTLFIGVLIFTLDLHHEMLKILFESFSLFPFSSSFLTGGVIDTLMETVQCFFLFALEYAAFPFLVLMGIILLLAIAAKMLPDVPIFWVSLPLQIFIGMAAFLMAASSFHPILQKAFLSARYFIERIFFELSYHL